MTTSSIAGFSSKSICNQIIPNKKKYQIVGKNISKRKNLKIDNYLIENDISVNNENGGSRRTQASSGGIADFADGSSTVDIISEIVLSHLLQQRKKEKEKKKGLRRRKKSEKLELGIIKV
jgi:hypothetical protein